MSRTVNQTLTAHSPVPSGLFLPNFRVSRHDEAQYQPHDDRRP